MGPIIGPGLDTSHSARARLGAITVVDLTLATLTYRRYGAIVVSLWRKQGRLRQELAQTQLSAQALGYPPEPYAVTVAMAAVASFLSAIGHPGNLLVYGLSGYQLADFAWVGTPLTILVALIVTWLGPMLWPR